MNLTYSEIKETFNALKKTGGYLEDEWNSVEAFLNGKNHFIFLGSGSSYSLAKSMSVMTFLNADVPAFAAAAGDILVHVGRYKKIFEGASVVCISRSGRTSEILMALDAMKEQGCSFTTASLICADDTPLAEKSDLALVMPWAFDHSVCQTRSVTNFYFASAYILAKKTGDRILMDDLKKIIDDGNEYMDKTEKLADGLARRPWTHSVILADAELEGIADEGAMAFKEICMLPSNYYHILDARHGPMVLFSEQTLLIAALGEKNELELNFLKDMHKKGAEVVALSDVPVSLEGCANIAYGRELSHIARGIPLIILCQMLCYKKALVNGSDPDKPTGLDPWISL